MAPSFSDPLTQRIVDFIDSVGLEVRKEPLPEDTFLPGIRIFEGAIVVDEERLAFPGDLLHEAGHLAVMPAEVRARLSDNVRETHPQGDGGEPESIAWSYAAALAAGVDPAVVFHPEGYRGKAAGILNNFRLGMTVGITPLIKAGMTDSPYNPVSEDIPRFPAMGRWLR
ncbi:hypothetical protein [Endothiovibrio diazotrophicus]